jgi:glycosyltransferase involved in cell wall biosynthesis
MAFSIIIPSNRADELGKTIRSTAKLTGAAGWEFLVVDDTSPETTLVVKERRPRQRRGTPGPAAGSRSNG